MEMRTAGTNELLVRDLLGEDVRKVVSVGPKTPISDAAKIMAERQIGVVVVVDEGGEMAGIMSERDILAAVGETDEDFRDLAAGDLMTEHVITCRPDDAITNVILKLEALRIRHLVVVDDGGLYGVLSMRDVLEALSKLIVRNQLFGRRSPLYTLASALFGNSQPTPDATERAAVRKGRRVPVGSMECGRDRESEPLKMV